MRTLWFVVTLALAAAPASAQQIDIVGNWSANLGNFEERPLRGDPGVEVGEYVGMPINEAGLQKAEAWMPTLHSLLEWQGRPHPVTYSMRAPAPNFRLAAVIDPRTQEITAYTIVNLFGRADRTIWMDGRKHPSKYAEHHDTFYTDMKQLYFGGEVVEMLYQPAAITDGDLIVWFRKSDVVAAGDVLSTVGYPRIDLKRGGTVQGVLNALNRILDIAVPEFNNQGGTLIVPGHGRICNESDVAEYRDMITIVRDRIKTMVDKGMTLEQVKAAGPAKDYDPMYSTKEWTTDMFVETIYADLTLKRAS